jgi:hypothetical protein
MITAAAGMDPLARVKQGSRKICKMGRHFTMLVEKI